MSKRDRIDDIVLPMPTLDPLESDGPTRAGQEAVTEEVARQRQIFERYLRVADGSEGEPDILVTEVERARTEMREAEERMRLLIAYGREFISPQLYR
ncbi:hypothetical protein [Occultella gossypii]|uniref:Uncharacterized protein n=1 Tax=Occultella gossypii TaxID=2800820 RepID=A0ABS7SHU2_9MICO|nr:hypothetical protein [Occultella gossypii]MBZ2199389.1 hypothetical protein [Occultella gossypii]